jgi:hypothetical protein
MQRLHAREGNNARMHIRGMCRTMSRRPLQNRSTFMRFFHSKLTFCVFNEKHSTLAATSFFPVTFIVIGGRGEGCGVEAGGRGGEVRERGEEDDFRETKRGTRMGVIEKAAIQ